MKGYKVLITGGAGFIGSHLISALLKKQASVCVVDNFDPYYKRELKLENLKAFQSHSNFKFIEGDIRSPHLYEELESHSISPQGIIHLAALAGVKPSIERSHDYLNTNILGTDSLLNWAKNLKEKPTILLASSSSVYGNSKKMPLTEGECIDQPISSYAMSKRAAELLCYTYSSLYGLKISCLRLFTVYGPRQRPDLAIRKFTEQILSGMPISLYGDGNSFRDYTYVKDTVEGFIRCLQWTQECSVGRFDIFNIGGGKPLKLVEMVQLIEKNLKIKAKINYLPMQPGDVDGTFANNTKAEQAFGYSPQTTHEQGFEETIHWLKGQISSLG